MPYENRLNFQKIHLTDIFPPRLFTLNGKQTVGECKQKGKKGPCDQENGTGNAIYLLRICMGSYLRR
jgi:hypothetical protein